MHHSQFIHLSADLAAASYSSSTNHPSRSHIYFSLDVPRQIDWLEKMMLETQTQTIMYPERDVNISSRYSTGTSFSWTYTTIPVYDSQSELAEYFITVRVKYDMYDMQCNARDSLLARLFSLVSLVPLAQLSHSEPGSWGLGDPFFPGSRGFQVFQLSPSTSLHYPALSKQLINPF